MPALSVAFIAAMSMYPSSPEIYGPPPSAPRALPGFKPGVGREIRDIRSDIEDGRESGQLSRTQARHLKQEAREIRELEERYSEGGLTDSEESELRTRVEVLRAITNAKRIGTIE